MSPKASTWMTVGIIAGCVILACLSMRFHWILWLAISVGALGGLTHEIAQSGGKIVMPRQEPDGLYLGSLAGAVLGLVAGLLVVRGSLASGGKALASADYVQLTYEIFLAGLALKGVTEAASGKSPSTSAGGRGPGGSAGQSSS